MTNTQDEYPYKLTNASRNGYICEGIFVFMTLYILPTVLYTSLANVFLIFDTCLISGKCLPYVLCMFDVNVGFKHF